VATINRWSIATYDEAYRYAAYEQTALKRLTGRHGTRDPARGAVRRPVRRGAGGIRIGKPSAPSRSSRTSTGIIDAASEQFGDSDHLRVIPVDDPRQQYYHADVTPAADVDKRFVFRYVPLRRGHPMYDAMEQSG
jgi:hypothetical protein